MVSLPATCPACSGDLHTIARFTEAPEGETDYGLHPYDRTLLQCNRCSHVVNESSHDLESIYETDYRTTTYGERAIDAFDRIMALPPGKSDNRLRVERVRNNVLAHGGPTAGSALDVGSGLAVFPAALAAHGWDCVALDPDPRAAEQADQLDGVRAIAGPFDESTVEGTFDLITLNKVIEHVSDPVALLKHAEPLLTDRGLVYIEVPDAEGALDVGPEREEFFVEHYHAFSAASAVLAAAKAGLRTVTLLRLIEPSGKYTICAFLRPT